MSHVLTLFGDVGDFRQKGRQKLLQLRKGCWYAMNVRLQKDVEAEQMYKALKKNIEVRKARLNDISTRWGCSMPSNPRRLAVQEQIGFSIIKTGYVNPYLQLNYTVTIFYDINSAIPFGNVENAVFSKGVKQVFALL